MSRLFGPIFQNGYVVRDLDAALDHWTRTVGVGPFYVTKGVPFASLFYRGAPAEIDMNVAISFSGDTQIELIQQPCGRPSIYTDFMAERGEGLHHVGVLTETFPEDVARLTAGGAVVIQGGRTGGLDFAYFESDARYPGSMVELIQKTRGMTRFLDSLKEKTRDWDGSEPVRSW